MIKSLALAAVLLAPPAALDGLSTRACLRSRPCIEVNPILRSASAHPGQLLALKIATNGVITVDFAWLRKKHPRWAWVVLGAGIGTQAVAGAHNTYLVVSWSHR